MPKEVNKFGIAQKEVDDWISQYKIGYFRPLSLMASLTEEVGEVARIMNRKHGDKVAKPNDLDLNLKEELSDVLFTTICIANSEGINLDEAWQITIDKLYGRDKDRWEKK